MTNIYYKSDTRDKSISLLTDLSIFLHFYYNFLHEQGLAEEKIEDMKEAVTVLLNQPPFIAITNYQGRGYPKHQALRERIFSFYKQNQNFDGLIEEIIKKNNQRKQQEIQLFHFKHIPFLLNLNFRFQPACSEIPESTNRLPPEKISLPHH